MNPQDALFPRLKQGQRDPTPLTLRRHDEHLHGPASQELNSPSLTTRCISWTTAIYGNRILRGLIIGVPLSLLLWGIIIFALKMLFR